MKNLFSIIALQKEMAELEEILKELQEAVQEFNNCLIVSECTQNKIREKDLMPEKEVKK